MRYFAWVGKYRQPGRSASASPQASPPALLSYVNFAFGRGPRNEPDLQREFPAHTLAGLCDGRLNWRSPATIAWDQNYQVRCVDGLRGACRRQATCIDHDGPASDRSGPAILADYYKSNDKRSQTMTRVRPDW